MCNHVFDFGTVLFFGSMVEGPTCLGVGMLTSYVIFFEHHDVGINLDCLLDVIESIIGLHMAQVPLDSPQSRITWGADRQFRREQ